MFESLRDGKNEFVFKRPANDLHADGEAVARKADRDRSAWETYEIEPLGVAHGIAIAGAGPVVSFAVAKRRGGGNRREKDSNVVHLAEDFFAEKIAFGTGLDELIEREGIGRSGVREIFAQHRTELCFVAGEIGVEQVRDDGAKEEPPEFEGAIEAAQFEWLDAKAASAEPFCGAVDCRARFRGGVTKRRALKNSDAHPTQIFLGIGAKRDRCRVSITGVGAGHDFEKSAHIVDGTGHGTYDADPTESACARGKMAGGGNAAGRGF